MHGPNRRRLALAAVLAVTVGYLVLIVTLFPPRGRGADGLPGWAQPLFAVGVPVVVIGVILLAGTRRPSGRLPPDRVSESDRLPWRIGDPGEHAPPSRFGGRNRVLTARHAGEGIALEIGTSRDTGAVHLAVCLPAPVGDARLAVCRLAGYRCTAVYRSIARWRFRTGDPGFDRRFFVDTDDPAAARDLLTPAVTRWLTADARVRSLGLVVEDEMLACWVSGEFREPIATAMLGYLADVRRCIEER